MEIKGVEEITGIVKNLLLVTVRGQSHIGINGNEGRVYSPITTNLGLGKNSFFLFHKTYKTPVLLFVNRRYLGNGVGAMGTGQDFAGDQKKNARRQ